MKLKVEPDPQKFNMRDIVKTFLIIAFFPMGDRESNFQMRNVEVKLQGIFENKRKQFAVFGLRNGEKESRMERKCTKGEKFESK